MLLLPFRLTALVPTWCVVENDPVPPPTVVSVPGCALPDESAAVVPLASSNLYQSTMPEPMLPALPPLPLPVWCVSSYP